MAAGDRSKKIKDRIKLITGISNTEIPDSMIYSIADTIVERIAEETLSIQKNQPLAVLSGGSGATATAILSSGTVSSFTITAAGNGYISAPTITFAGGGGSGATATATLSGATVSSLTVVSAGSGYTSTPTVTISGGGGANEPSGLFKIKVVIMPSSTYLQPIEVDAITFDEYSRVSPVSSSFIPKIYKRWIDTSGIKKLTFFPSETATYSILYYAIPTTNISSSIDPETPTRYDNLIYYGVLSELLPIKGKLDIATYYRGLFINELETSKNLQRKEKSTTNLISFYDI